ncbi:hypothetical protein BDV96DRAFT_377230 [Lophiotrema nucula]|uniref:Mid2 domain-containing protein n=1 Tax=Lophiotrema nucula TaxID=690887 RepID=A0A6A5YGM1_9PLEO|nr:hypothetical protein BDV96DRAFT_377230 [Lophiotrema nucula]
MYCLIGLSTVLALSTFSSAKCFFPNGDESPSDTACNPDAIESACCFDGQACLSNGLCVSDPHIETLARLHRGTCTDANWKSGNCPRECLDIDNNGVPVYSCNSTSTDQYCCFDNCQCNSRFDVFSFAGTPDDVYTMTIIGEAFTQTRSSASTTASSSASQSIGTHASITNSRSGSASPASQTSTATSAPTSSTAAATENSSSNSTAIGVGVGVGLGAAILIGAGAFFLYRRKRRGANPYIKEPVEAPAGNYYPPPPAEPVQTKHAYFSGDQANAAHERLELPAQSYDPIELPTYPAHKDASPAQHRAI